jgi:hypothetical protein
MINDVRALYKPQMQGIEDIEKIFHAAFTALAVV